MKKEKFVNLAMLTDEELSTALALIRASVKAIKDTGITNDGDMEVIKSLQHKLSEGSILRVRLKQ